MDVWTNGLLVLRAVVVVESSGKPGLVQSPSERIVTIEDPYELFPDQKNSVCLKASRSGAGEMTPAKLLEGTLLMRPDRNHSW